jgi:bifunctional DNA-binding transcriptional regulator/antitoxin component of YhaV-PrlF toxin-antitoxin module
MSVDVLTVSSKGQVVLPINMRRALSIVEGAKLAAYAIGDTIMLKPISVPTEEDFHSFLDEAQAWAEASGLDESDVAAAITDVRGKARQ